MKPTLWVFGFWQFMQFFIPYLSPFFEIYVYDKWGKSDDIVAVWALSTTKEQVASCDYVLLWYPAKYTEWLVKDIAPYIKNEAVVFDICSVKTPAVDAMIHYLPKDCSIIATHPIFWPQSGKNGIKGLKCVISNIRAKEETYNALKKIFEENLGLKVFEMSPEEHDREMAYIQWITHFIGRALKNIAIPGAPLSTMSYDHLRETSELVWYDSEDLFFSIQNDNPYAQEVRELLMNELENLDRQIQEKIVRKRGS